MLLDVQVIRLIHDLSFVWWIRYHFPTFDSYDFILISFVRRFLSLQPSPDCFVSEYLIIRTKFLSENLIRFLSLIFQGSDSVDHPSCLFLFTNDLPL